VHTLGSLPAIPAAVYMLACHGRIVPRSTAGAVYFVSMLIGAVTVFLVARQPVSYGIGVATLVLPFAGYRVGQLSELGRAASYIETICLSLTAFLLMVPTVTETLRRVPVGDPLVTDPNSPLLLGCQAALLVTLVVGLTAQIIALRKQDRIMAREIRAGSRRWARSVTDRSIALRQSLHSLKVTSISQAASLRSGQTGRPARDRCRRIRLAAMRSR
jgi:hypothetical protein